MCGVSNGGVGSSIESPRSLWVGNFTVGSHFDVCRFVGSAHLERLHNRQVSCKPIPRVGELAYLGGEASLLETHKSRVNTTRKNSGKENLGK